MEQNPRLARKGYPGSFRRIPRRDGLWKQIVEGGLEEWLFHAIDAEKLSFPEIAKAMGAKGIQADPAAIYMLSRRKRLDFESRQAAREILSRGLDGEPNQVTAALLRERLQVLATLDQLRPKEVVDALTLELREKDLEVRRIEALRKLFEMQSKAAEFLADFIRDQVKMDRLKEIAAQRSLTGPEFIELVRRRVYGDACVAPPTGESVAVLRAGLEWTDGQPTVEPVEEATTLAAEKNSGE